MKARKKEDGKKKFTVFQMIFRKKFQRLKQLPAQPYKSITGLVQTRFSMMVSFSKSIGMMIAWSAKEVSGIRAETLQVIT